MSKRALSSQWDTLQEWKRLRRSRPTGQNQSLIPQTGPPNTYSHFHTAGHARVHAGNVYNITRDDLAGVQSPDSFPNVLLRTIGCVVFFDSRIADLLALDPEARSRDVEAKRWLAILTKLHNELQDRANADLKRMRFGATTDLEIADHAGFLVEAASSLHSSCIRLRKGASNLDGPRRKVRDLCDALASTFLGTLQKPAPLRASPDHPSNIALTSEMSANVRVAFSLFQNSKVPTLLFKLNEDMDRPRKVSEPFPETFRWALKDDEAGLRSWLQGGSGIYWITGKPGSGKSTLMKFLIDSSEHLLADWAGEETLVMANFFFWYAGNPLQKSIAGLLRSITYQLLQSNPTLANVAFPRWHPNQEPWTETDLVNALQNVINSAPSSPGERFCFFIDGLDEYDGKNHLELIKTIQELAQSRRVKLCISSRPLYAYRLAFGTSVYHLSLEKLNANDMLVYVSGRLTDESPFTAYDTSSLVAEVVHGSEGVFLWVMLVVESILEGFAEGESMPLIRHRVKEFPQDLEPFFKAILQRVSPRYKARSGQALKLAWLSTKFFGYQICTPNCIDYWLIGQHPKGIQDPTFAYQLSPEVIGADRSSLILKETRQLLSAATKGLLVLNGAESKVEVIHRTVHEFLDSAQMTQELNDSVPDHFKSTDMLHLLNIARMKLWPDSLVLSESIFFWNGAEAIYIQEQEHYIADRKIHDIVDSFYSSAKTYSRQYIEPGSLAQLNASGEYATEFERAVNHVRHCWHLPPLEKNTFHNLDEILAVVMEINSIFRIKIPSDVASQGRVLAMGTRKTSKKQAPSFIDELCFKDYTPEILRDQSNYPSEILLDDES